MLVCAAARPTHPLSAPRVREAEGQVPHRRRVRKGCKAKRRCGAEALRQPAAVCCFTRMRAVSSKSGFWSRLLARGFPFLHTICWPALSVAFLSGVLLSLRPAAGTCRVLGARAGLLRAEARRCFQPQASEPPVSAQSGVLPKSRWVPGSDIPWKRLQCLLQST